MRHHHHYLKDHPSCLVCLDVPTKKSQKERIKAFINKPQGNQIIVIGFKLKDLVAYSYTFEAIIDSKSYVVALIQHSILRLLNGISIHLIESLTQASIFSPLQLASSLLDRVAEAQRVQVSTRRAAVNSTQPKHSQDCLNVST